MKPEGDRHIVAMGGWTVPQAHSVQLPPLLSYALELSGAARPRVCVLETASGDATRSYLSMYLKLARHGAIASHLQLFTRPNVSDPEELLLSQDVIFVGGGSLMNLLAVWPVHGLDTILRRAWESGVVLAGVSAGAMCWFEGGITDSFGLPYRTYDAGLGLLSGSFSPHHTGEPGRRPAFRQAIADGALAAGVACDDGAAAHFTGRELTGVVRDRPGSAAYLVRPDGGGGASEELLEARTLTARRPAGRQAVPGLRSFQTARACYDGYRRYRGSRLSPAAHPSPPALQATVPAAGTGQLTVPAQVPVVLAAEADQPAG